MNIIDSLLAGAIAVLVWRSIIQEMTLSKIIDLVDEIITVSNAVVDKVNALDAAKVAADSEIASLKAVVDSGVADPGLETNLQAIKDKLSALVNPVAVAAPPVETAPVDPNIPLS